MGAYFEGGSHIEKLTPRQALARGKIKLTQKQALARGITNNEADTRNKRPTGADGEYDFDVTEAIFDGVDGEGESSEKDTQKPQSLQ